MINTILLIIVIVMLIQISAKIPPRDYINEAIERDRKRKEEK